MKVSNPLTIIAIFSGVAEAFATYALVNLPIETQKIFVYFVMAFPTLIVILFFIILVFKNKALYAPSDFDNQDHYLEINNLKQDVLKDVTEALDDIDKDNQKLTEEDKKALLSNINKTIDKSFESSRREQILSHLKDGAASTMEICGATGLHPSYASLILNNLHDEGIVAKEKMGRESIWALNA